MEYRYGSHTVFNIEYHFVWVTKYRYHMLTGDIALRVRELVRQTCEAFEIQNLSGVVSKDHVHIFCPRRQQWHRVKLCVVLKEERQVSCLVNFQLSKSVTGVGTFGREDISVPRPAKSLTI